MIALVSESYHVMHTQYQTLSLVHGARVYVFIKWING